MIKLIFYQLQHIFKLKRRTLLNLLLLLFFIILSLINPHESVFNILLFVVLSFLLTGLMLSFSFINSYNENFIYFTLPYSRPIILFLFYISIFIYYLLFLVVFTIISLFIKFDYVILIVFLCGILILLLLQNFSFLFSLFRSFHLLLFSLITVLFVSFFWRPNLLLYKGKLKILVNLLLFVIPPFDRLFVLDLKNGFFHFLFPIVFTFLLIFLIFKNREI